MDDIGFLHIMMKLYQVDIVNIKREYEFIYSHRNIT